MDIDKNSAHERKELSMREVIDFCRHRQKQHKEHGAEASGIDCLKDALERGIIDLVQFCEIYPAIVNYTTPYELLNTAD